MTTTRLKRLRVMQRQMMQRPVMKPRATGLTGVAPVHVRQAPGAPGLDPRPRSARPSKVVRSGRRGVLLRAVGAAAMIAAGGAGRAAIGAPAQTGQTATDAQAAAAPLPRVIVLNSRDASVSLIDQATFQEAGRVAVGKEPHHLYPTPDGRQLIVAGSVSNSLFFLDPASGTIQKTVPGIDDPYQLAFSPDRRWFVTAALRLNRVDVYHNDDGVPRLASRIAAPRLPSHVWFSPDSRTVYVTLQESDEVAAIDVESQKMIWKIPVGKQPAGIVVSPDGARLFVGIMGQDHVQVIDPKTQATLARIVTGAGAHNFRGLGDGRRLLVSNRVAGTVTYVDMNDLTAGDTIAVPGGPDCMDLADDGRTLWVSSRWAKQVSIVDLAQKQVVRRISVGRSPHGIFLANRVATI